MRHTDAVRRRWQDAGRSMPDQDAMYAAYAIYSAYTITSLAIVTGLDPQEYRGYLRMVIERECAPVGRGTA